MIVWKFSEMAGSMLKRLHVAHCSSVAVAMILAACSVDEGNQSTESKVADRDVAKVVSKPISMPPNKDLPTNLKPMTEAEIRRVAIGCFPPPPYPPDSGPTCFRVDGSWQSYSGWGGDSGRLRINRNGMFLDDARGKPVGEQPDLRFFKNPYGRFFVRTNYPSDPVILFRPYPEDEYLKPAR